MSKQGLIHLTVAGELASARATTEKQGAEMRKVIEENLADLAPKGALWLSFAGTFEVAAPFLDAAIGGFHRDGRPVYGDSVFITDATMGTILMTEDAADEGDRAYAAASAPDGQATALASEPAA